MSINLVRYEGHTVTPKIDARLSHKVHTKDAIYEGCVVSIVATNQLHITSGNGIIQGGEFEIVEQDLLVALPTDVTTYGVGYGLIYIRINLSDLTTPIELKSVIYKSTALDPSHYNLTQDSDLYGTNGVWEIPICLYSANLTSVTLVQQNKSVYANYDGQMIEYNQDIFETSERNISPLFEIGTSIVIGARRIHEGVLYESTYNSGGLPVTSWNPSHWQRIDIDSILTKISKPATVGTGTTVATSLTNGQVFTAPSDGVYQVLCGFSAIDGYLTFNHSNGQTPHVKPCPTPTYQQYVAIPINAGQTLTVNLISKAQSIEVKFFAQYA